MSMFPGASGFIISGSNLNAQSTTNINQYGRSGIDILRDASSPGAAFDSPEHYDRRCFPGTREQYIADITNWVTESIDMPSSVYWMRGPAGVGKSAIAQTCAEKLKETGHLGAAFFFTVKGNNNSLRLFTTIAYQLSTTLPDYRVLVDERISKDKTLVEKKISSQFKSLIIEPLRELEKQGKGVQPKAIFIDGLDECAGEDAQAEIIKMIASSVGDGSTPFRWAIFSRAEPRIVSTFKQDNVASVTHSVELPISRDADGEIEMYLRGEFKSILEHRDYAHLSSSWPADNDIKILVDAADGLFAHPSAVLRHVAYPRDCQFRERLQSVLDALSQPGNHAFTLPFSHLDALYVHIMSQIPERILPSAQLFLSHVALGNSVIDVGVSFYVATVCSVLKFSESTFRDINHYLHAVIAYEASFDPLSSIDPRIDLTRSFFDQGQWFHPELSFVRHLRSVHGSLRFYHKSFYDFLRDPARSGPFCVATLDIYCKLIDQMIQNHHHYASSYAIDGSKLVLGPGIVSSSDSLSWPQGTEFVDSYLKLRSFFGLSIFLSYDSLGFYQFIEHVPLDTLRQLTELDYRKTLVANRMHFEFFGLNHRWVSSVPGIAKILSHTVFECIRDDKFDDLVPAEFLSVVNKLKKAGVIRRYYPHFGSSRVTTLLHTLSRKNSVRRNSGLYRLGHGEKSVIWYWEFDIEKRYFHQFRTIDYAAAVEFYKANKFTLWQEENGEDGESNGKGDQVDAEEERDDQEDDQAHGKDGTESQNKEQREAATDVQDQGHSENDARHESDDTEDNGNREEHGKSK